MRILKTKLWGAAVLVFSLARVEAAAQTVDDFFNPKVLHEIRIDIKSNDWDTLKKNYLLNDYYDCDFTWRYPGRDILVTDISIRSRGTGSRSPLKPGLRVDFNRNISNQTFLGLKSVVLRNNTQDASMMHERLSMLFFQRMGLPASREAHTRLYVNDEYAGLYTIVESLDKPFLKSNFSEDDGYLYEWKWVEAYYFQYLGSDPSLYSTETRYFKPETHEKDPDPKPIERMIWTINNSSDANFTRDMAEYLDLKLFMTHLAIERFVEEQDGIVGGYGMNNFYFYRFEKKNLSQFLAWDKSEAFKNVPTESIWRFITDVPQAQQNVLMRRCLLVPELRTTYLEALASCARLAGGADGFLAQEIEREYKQIREAARADPNKQYLGGGALKLCSNECFEAEIDRLRDFARKRSDHVLNEVAESLTAASKRSFSIRDKGGMTLSTLGGTGSTVVGYARIQPDTGSTTPSGLAIFGFRQNDILVTEAGVPASPLIKEGRVYAEVDKKVSTGLAIANPNNQTATIAYYYTDLDGRKFGEGSTTIPANGQIAEFLNQTRFNGGSSVSGTFTFSSGVSVSAIALRGLVNERSEFLITTLPVSGLSATVGERVILPHFADGGGWTTQIVLVNPTDESISGTVEFFDQGSSTAGAQPATVTVDGKMGSTFSYTIAGRSSRRLQTSGLSKTVQAGSVRVVPSADNKSPSALAIFSYKDNGVTVSEAGVPATKPASAFRMYAEVDEENSIQTGVAIANPSSTEAKVDFELTDLSGKSTGLMGKATIPANGQTAVFLNQIAGFESLKLPFQGVLRISTTASSGISAMGLRGRTNGRGDFLITTTPPVDENSVASSAELLFPHLADDGGYTTQFIIFSGSKGQTSSGALRFLAQSGQTLELLLW